MICYDTIYQQIVAKIVWYPMVETYLGKDLEKDLVKPKTSIMWFDQALLPLLSLNRLRLEIHCKVLSCCCHHELCR